MTRLVKSIATIAVFVAGTHVFGQSAMPFKLGTFDQNGRAFVGIVLKDAIVIDLGQASAALKTPASKVAPPVDMKDLIARYDSGVRARIGEILANTKPLEGSGRPSFVHDLTSLKTLPPIMYPTTMLNVAVNYRAHAAEMAGGALAGRWNRTGRCAAWHDERAGHLGAQAGRQAMEPVHVLQVADDRDCQRRGDPHAGRPHQHRLGVRAWASCSAARPITCPSSAPATTSSATRSRTTCPIAAAAATRGTAPTGCSARTTTPSRPWARSSCPKEFVPNPQNLQVKFTLNGQVMQDANTSLMIHSVVELVSYGSHILTLRPGDVIATGSPAGVGSARNPPIFFKAGDVSVCTYEGIGTLTNPIVAPRAAAR